MKCPYTFLQVRNSKKFNKVNMIPQFLLNTLLPPCPNHSIKILHSTNFYPVIPPIEEKHTEQQRHTHLIIVNRD